MAGFMFSNVWGDHLTLDACFTRTAMSAAGATPSTVAWEKVDTSPERWDTSAEVTLNYGLVRESPQNALIIQVKEL